MSETLESRQGGQVLLNSTQCIISTLPNSQNNVTLPNQSQPIFDNGSYVTTYDAAKLFGTTVKGIYMRVYRGQLRPFKPFGEKGISLFRRDELIAHLEASRKGG